jgi:Uma2 family endonuclease
MAIKPAQPPITVTQYYQMLADGTLREDDRVELIEGDLHWMAPIGSRHAACINFLAATLPQLATGRAVIGVQNPIHLDDHNEPQPDLYVARWRADYYRAGHPTPADLLLLIEVADSTLNEDRRIKAPLYARFGIPEYWIVNLLQNVLEVYADPQDGQYLRRVLHRPGEEVAPQAFRELLIAVEVIVG